MGVSQIDIANGMQAVELQSGLWWKSALEIMKSSNADSDGYQEDYNQIILGTTQIMSQFGLKTDDASKTWRMQVKFKMR